MAGKETLFDGKHLRLVQRGGWEFVERPKVSGIVGIVAITDDRKVVLVEQFRVPVNAFVIELPAGLAGDIDAAEDLLTAARRELLEETGYEAQTLEVITAGTTSAGLCSEIVTLVRATGLTRTTQGGGVEGEQITVHEVPVDDLADWLAEHSRQGRLFDLKILAVPALACR